MNTIWRKFSALGTEVVITAVLPAEQAYLLEEAERVVHDFEQRYSRFVVGNELYQLNGYAGQNFEASDMLVDILNEANNAYDLTKGVFDPTIIGSLEKVGYDQRFDDLSVMGETGEEHLDLDKIKEEFMLRPKFQQLIVQGNRLSKPEGLRLDFGGLGKGYIVDFLSSKLFVGIRDFWISAGGDLAVKGSEAGGTGWLIGVQNPHQPDKEIFSVRTKGQLCGIATSGVFKRKGRHGGHEWHHLIDPRNGLPAVNDVLAVTAIASNAKRADVFAKTVLILGEQAGLDFIDSQDDSAAVVFLKNGRVIFSKQALQFIKL